MAAALVLCSGNAFAQNRSLSGKVVDGTGAPIIGAAVMVAGQTSNGTVTDFNGQFQLTVPANATLIVSCLGFADKQVAVGNQSVVTIMLEEDVTYLDETVVIGYGVQKKSDLTGAVASVRQDDLKNRSTSDAAAALQGKVAGVQIITNSGAPGSGASINVRGVSSNSGNIGPLIIVDGLKVNSIQYLDPSLIESMEVLKDAASAAIYGAEAGNGVVLVTTKQGGKGHASITYSGKFINQSLAHKPEMLNAEQFIDYKGLQGYAIQEQLENAHYNGTDTDWFSEYFNPSWNIQHTVSFQGGNNYGHYFASINYVNQDGIVKGDKDLYKRLSAQLNADYNLTNWLQVGNNISIEQWSTKSVSQQGYGSAFESLMTIDPTTPVYWTDPSQFNQDYRNKYDAVQEGTSEYPYSFLGDENGWFATSAIDETRGGSPFVQRDATDGSSGGINVHGVLFANLKPFKGLVFTSRFGFRITQSNNHSYSAPYFSNGKADVKTYSLNATANTGLYYQWENFANYNTTIANKHNINVMAGMSFIKNTSDNVSGTASGSDILKGYDPNFRYLNYVKDDATKKFSNSPSESASLSYFARLGYSYDNRYSIQANFRADAFDSSKLSPENRWGYFPSVSAGWTISNEPWFKNSVSPNTISFLKVRSSWGYNGNVNVLSGYPYSTSISLNSQWYQYHVDQTGNVYGSAPDGLANPNLTWEKSNQIDAGLDARFLNNRLSFTLDWYRKETRDLLVSYSPPPEYGVSRVTSNAGNVLNTGIEAELGWKDTIGDFSYGINGNFSYLKNRVTYLLPSLPRITQSPASGSNYPIETVFEVGQPIWYIRGYIYDGVKEDGTPNLRDVNGDEQISDADMTNIGKGLPDYTYGITLNLEWKGLDFIVFGSGQGGCEILNTLYRPGYHNSLRYFYLNSRSEKNPNALFPEPAKVSGDMNFWGSTASVFDGSFFKIRQVQLGYTIPQKLTKKVLINQLRLYVSLDDFFTFTSYPGMDPETATSGSASGRGVDIGAYPSMRKCMFGVTVSF
ncbi:MAG: TonB-dependent receptor [Bacteroidales bacterium]|nr:TonB-dependent receptor [Bacteroidales bacterium]